uniref:Uncharacterized protein n=1 Tax=uncultured marine virus TaxID=186617 RepID=A0A0F7L4E2_9VIRU|nr:hypothetical protein [uncultured marine virus]
MSLCLPNQMGLESERAEVEDVPLPSLRPPARSDACPASLRLLSSSSLSPSAAAR